MAHWEDPKRPEAKPYLKTGGRGGDVEASTSALVAADPVTRRRAATTCGWCGVAIQPKARGRIPTWCSPACRQRAWEQARAVVSGRSAGESRRATRRGPRPGNANAAGVGGAARRARPPGGRRPRLRPRSPGAGHGVAPRSRRLRPASLCPRQEPPRHPSEPPVRLPKAGWRHAAPLGLLHRSSFNGDSLP